MSKHSPGPWAWDDSGLGLLRDGDDAIVLRAIQGGDGSPDARLIAAAPELLEALKAMVRDACYETTGRKASTQAARALIRHIEGEE